MVSFKKRLICHLIHCKGYFLFLIWLSVCLQAEQFDTLTNPKGHLLFLIQHGQHQQAIKIYQKYFQETKQHDFEILHRIGLGILDHGFRQKDPESQLLALFGASVSAHEDAFYIIEGSLKNRQPQIQLIAVGALARFQDDIADQALIRALGSKQLLIQYEAVRMLCKMKHPKAESLAESLMYKLPTEFWPAFPDLFAISDKQNSTNILLKLLNHSSNEIRLASIISVGEHHRDDLIVLIRKLMVNNHFAQQEACAKALGELKDESSIPQLKVLTTSQYSHVALTAAFALYQMGIKDAKETIENYALKKDLFAIALLGKIEGSSELLVSLASNSDSEIQIRLNCLVSLLQQNHPKALDMVDEFLIRDQRDLAFNSQLSSGRALKIWKVTSSAGELLKEDLSAYLENLQFKEYLIQKVREISEDKLIQLAHVIFNRQQNELVPIVSKNLEELNSKNALTCLIEHHQQLGAPFVRMYCNLSLYRLQEEGPYRKNIQDWVKKQSQTDFIRFQSFNPWKIGQESFSLTPEETSKILIEACETLAQNQDLEGIETLTEVIATGHSKNKYALAGLLVRAAQ